jgi:threonyl-tRNA synthetase
MSEISVTLPDGSSRRLPAGSTPGDVAGQVSPRLAKAALAAVVDDKLVDLTFPIQKDSSTTSSSIVRSSPKTSRRLKRR